MNTINHTNYLAKINDLAHFLFEKNSITPSFPDIFTKVEESDIRTVCCAYREDFRNDNAFTIDCESCMDMDDAVSIRRDAMGFELSVHIADVSAFIPFGSDWDQLALMRGSSIYLPTFSVPMLPAILTNNLCSLNPNEDRYAISIIMNLDNDGNTVGTRVTKSKIHSRVKGIYSEVNKLLAGTTDEALRNKYSEVYCDLLDMQDLYHILRAKHIARGGKIEDNSEPLIVVAEDSIDVTPRPNGMAERMIEEFMVLANYEIANYLLSKNLPAVFRYQEESNGLAAYGSEVEKHSDLQLNNYVHFTSPIRRLADLKIHQILSMHLNGMSSDEIHQILDEHLIEACEQATKKFRAVKSIQDKVKRYCYEQFLMLNYHKSFNATLIAYNKQNCPVFQIDSYNFKVVGSPSQRGKIGKTYTLRFDFSAVTSPLMIRKMSPVSA